MYSVRTISFAPFSLNENIIKTIIGIGATFIIIFILFLTYYVKLKKQKDNLIPTGYVFVFQIYIEYIHNLVLQILGKKFEKITPFFIYLFSYILISNTISVFGLTNPTSSLSVAISLGLVTFIGIFVVGFKYQRLSFLKKYTFNITTKKGKSIPVMINPINIAGQVAPLISISFRLWGNIFAGSLIIGMVLSATSSAVDSMLPFKFFDFFGLFALLPLHLYFDILSGVIQTLVFCLLTMVYWKMEANHK
jgi:F-type H+-transporting ATPase subunit a